MFAWVDPDYLRRLLDDLSGRPGERIDLFLERSSGLVLDADPDGTAPPRSHHDSGFAVRLVSPAGTALRCASPLDENRLKDVFRSFAHELGVEPFFRKPRRFGSRPQSSVAPPPSRAEAELDTEARRILERLELLATRERVGLVGARVELLHRHRALLVRTEPWRDWERTEVHLTLHLRRGERQAVVRAGGVRWDSGLEAHLRRIIAARFPDEPFRPAPSRTPVTALFAEGTAASFFHEVLGHLLEADALAEGLSPLLPVLGTTVAPPTLTVWDDPTRLDLPGGLPADDEGIPAMRQPLLEEGRLGVPLGDWSLRDFGPPGRARRASWSEPPLPRVTNIVVEPGRAGLDAMLKTVSRGLLVTSLDGGNVDPASGRFSLKIGSARWIRKGNVGDPCPPLWLAGDLFPSLEMMRPEVGDEPAVDHGSTVCTRRGQSVPVGGSAPIVAVPGLVTAPGER